MIRNYMDSDLEYLQQLDVIASLELQYHGDVIKNAVFTAVDQEGACHGILYFQKHYTGNEELKRMVPCIYSEEDSYSLELLQYAIKWYQEQANSDQKLCLAAWLDDSDMEGLQLYMHEGFMEYMPCPCLKYDLTKELELYQIPEGMTIRRLEFVPEDVEKYIAATKEANDGIADSVNELWFLHGGGNYSIYLLMDGETIVSAASSWRITKERSAIENIFTAKEYRRKGMAKTIMLYTLKQIQNENYRLATLSMVGRNIKALRLYQSLGFELFYNQIEMIYKY